MSLRSFYPLTIHDRHVISFHQLLKLTEQVLIFYIKLLKLMAAFMLELSKMTHINFKLIYYILFRSAKQNKIKS
jgi:hypothetical protein